MRTLSAVGDSSGSNSVEDVATSLAKSLMDRAWSGWDPYDALASPLAKVLPGRRLRQAWVQLHKRSPINFRPFLGIRKRQMSKTAALAILAAERSSSIGDLYANKVSQLREALTSSVRRKDGCAWWGYEFPVQTRWAYYGAGAPNAVVTSFVVEALLAGSEQVDRDLLTAVGDQLEQMAASSESGTYFRYVATSDSFVFNASALAAAALGSIGAVAYREDWRDLAFQAADTIAHAQTKAGGWPYGTSPGLDWEDGFHTAYVLLSLNRLRHLGWVDATASLPRGLSYFLDAFTAPGGRLRYLAFGRPLDEAHNLGTCLRALVDLREFDPRSIDRAEEVTDWGIRRLWMPRSRRFRTRRGRFLATRISYPRWSDAHVLLGLACFMESRQRPES